MGGLGSYARRSLAARPLRTLLTILGVALGVGVLFTALTTNAGIDGAVDRTVAGLIGRADLRIEGFTEAGLSASTLGTIAETPGVAVAALVLERRTYPAPDPAIPLGDALPAPVTVLGIDPASYPAIHDLALVAGGPLAGVVGPGALIPERLARQMGAGVGDSITLNGSDGPRAEPIVGILAGDGPLEATDGRTVVLGLGEAQTLFGTGVVSRVDVRVAPDSTADGVARALQERLTQEPYVLSGPADLARGIRASTADFQATTILIAALALFAGAFLIFNTLSMTVAERAREVGLLRAAGATRRQVNGLVMVQAVILGVAGSLLGVGVGLGLAAFVGWYLRSVGIVRIEGPTPTVGAVLVAVLVGTLVTLAAAVEPAVRAGRISPVDALRPAGAGPAVRARLRWLVVVFVVLAAAGLVLAPGIPSSASAVRWLAVYGILLVATLLTPFLLGPLGRLAGLPFGLVAPAASRLARGALVRDRGRTTLTVGALTVGLAMIVALGGLAQDARRAATAWVASVVPGDLVASSIRPVALDEPAVDALAGSAGVTRVSPMGAFEVAFRGTRLPAAAMVGRDLLADGRLTLTDGDRTAALNALDEGGSAIVPVSLAASLGIHVGDAMRFPLGGSRTAELRVVGIAERTIPVRNGEAILVGWGDATETFGLTGADAFAIRLAPGATRAERAELTTTAHAFALEPSTLERIAGAVDDVLGRMFGLFDALAIFAVIVAGLGIVNTLTMNVAERVREIGVLRATGMTRRQVWRMVVVEAGVIGLVGSVLGCVTGLVAGQLMIGLAGGGVLRLPFEPDWRTVALVGIFGVVVAMLAAVWPARVAARISIVRAVQAE